LSLNESDDPGEIADLCVIQENGIVQYVAPDIHVTGTTSMEPAHVAGKIVEILG
jgi:hypothetical protein